MAGKNTAAFGIYPDEVSLRNGIETLEREGFRREDISVLFAENQGTKDFAHEKGPKLRKARRRALVRARW